MPEGKNLMQGNGKVLSSTHSAGILFSKRPLSERGPWQLIAEDM